MPSMRGHDTRNQPTRVAAPVRGTQPLPRIKKNMTKNMACPGIFKCSISATRVIMIKVAQNPSQIASRRVNRFQIKFALYQQSYNCLVFLL